MEMYDADTGETADDPWQNVWSALGAWVPNNAAFERAKAAIQHARQAVDAQNRTVLAEKDDAIRQLRLDLSDGQRLMDERDGARLAYRSVAERFGVVEAQLAAAQDAYDALAERDSHAVDAVCQQLTAQLAERDRRITALEADVKRWRIVGEHYEQQWAAEHAVPPVTGDPQ